LVDDDLLAFLVVEIRDEQVWSEVSYKITRSLLHKSILEVPPFSSPSLEMVRAKSILVFGGY
jgi:hypothetical protein